MQWTTLAAGRGGGRLELARGESSPRPADGRRATPRVVRGRPSGGRRIRRVCLPPYQGLRPPGGGRVLLEERDEHDVREVSTNGKTPLVRHVRRSGRTLLRPAGPEELLVRRAQIVARDASSRCEDASRATILARVDELFAKERVHEIARWIRRSENPSERGENAMDFWRLSAKSGRRVCFRAESKPCSRPLSFSVVFSSFTTKSSSFIDFSRFFVKTGLDSAQR